MAQPARLASRMQRELRMLQTDPPPGVCAWPVQESLIHLQAQIRGPQGTVYANGIFKLDIEVPDRYPFEPPSIRFITPVYHPNIDSGGRICLDILNVPPKGAWRPSLNLSTLLASIGLLLAEPNPDDGLMGEITSEYKHNRPSFDAKARKWTELYANGGEISEIATVTKPRSGQDSVTEDSKSKIGSSNSQNTSIDGSDQVPKRPSIFLSKKLALDRRAQINSQPEIGQQTHARREEEIQSKGLTGNNNLQNKNGGIDSIVSNPQPQVPGYIFLDKLNLPVDGEMKVTVLDDNKTQTCISKPLSCSDKEMHTGKEKPKALEGGKLLCVEKENKAPAANTNAITSNAGQRVVKCGDDNKTVNVCPFLPSRAKSLKLSRIKSEPPNVCTANVQQVKVSKTVLAIPDDAVIVSDSGSDDDDLADEGFKLSLTQRNYGNKRKAGSIRR